jgi:hypothetical protein
MRYPILSYDGLAQLALVTSTLTSLTVISYHSGLSYDDLRNANSKQDYFLGTPFAEPLIGSLRFQPPTPWSRGNVTVVNTTVPRMVTVACSQQRSRPTANLNGTSINTDQDVINWLTTHFTGLYFGISNVTTIREMLKYCPVDPAAGSPYGTGNNNFGQGAQYKRFASLIGNIILGVFTLRNSIFRPYGLTGCA